MSAPHRHALVWWSRVGAEQGTPWYVQLLDVPGEPPRRCVTVSWAGGEARTVYRREGFLELPDGPRGLIELRVEELRMVRAPDDADEPPPDTLRNSA